MGRKRRVEEELKEVMDRLSLTLSTAESCTGGLVAARVVNVPGSSSFFIGGVVAYDNRVKKELLKVREETLLKFGAVSQETAEEMALGALRLFNSDCSVSTTGIAGPGGGSSEKPVGLTYIGVAVKGKVEVYRFIFKDDSSEPVKRRNAIRKKAAKKALKLLLENLKGNN